MRKQTKLKAVVLSVMMLVGMLLPVSACAQKDGFIRDEDHYSNFNRDSEGMEWDGGGMTPQDPTQEAPLGGGLMLLVAAGAGYAALKRKEEQQ